MRPALPLISIAALAAVAVSAVAAGVQDEDSMDLPNDVAMDLETIGNSTVEEAPPALIWLPNRIWLWAAEEETGSVWYFDPWESDFTVQPYRVVLGIDESPDAGSPHDDTLRVAEIDCSGHRYRILSTIHYDDSGNASEADERGDGSLVRVVQGSVFAAVEDTVCRHAAEPPSTDMNAM